MKPRVLLFPLATAAVLAAEGCDGISINDPSVRACHADTTELLTRFPDNFVKHDTVIVRYPWQNCRAA